MSQQGYRDIATALGESGYCITPRFLDPDITARLLDEAKEAWQSGCFRHAGTGRGAGWELRPDIRSDKVMWMQPEGCGPAQAGYLATLESLRVALNRELFLGLRDFEGHLAVYPPGTRYHRHVDQFRGIGNRVLTCVLYLNSNWQDAWGGALRLYLDAAEDSGYVDVPPEAGTLVTFVSRDFFHEVLPATRDRYSITGWFRTNT